jgi:hypothetical protein
MAALLPNSVKTVIRFRRFYTLAKFRDALAYPPHYLPKAWKSKVGCA